MLVERIVTLVWRLRRVPAAEAGEIALSVDGGSWNRDSGSWQELALLMKDPTPLRCFELELKRTTKGLRYLLSLLCTMGDAVDKDGELTEAAVKDYTVSLRGQRTSMTKRFEELRAWLTANPEKLEPEALRARHRAEVLGYIKNESIILINLLESRERREEKEERAHQQAANLPADDVLDKILRYETTLERQLFRTMNQLERLQRRRKGEAVPPPLAVDISARA